VVRILGQAGIHASRLVIWSGLDNSLWNDGDIIVYDLEKGIGQTGGGRRAFMVFLAQLMVNAIWSPVFVGLRMPRFAFVVIILLWLLIVLTVVLSAKVSHFGALLLVPYLGWVTFAIILNGAILHLN